jgi:hypothetical protein
MNLREEAAVQAAARGPRVLRSDVPSADIDTFEGRVRGLQNEIRVLAAMATVVLPPWIKSIRPGTREEDYSGRDIVIVQWDDPHNIGIQL